MSQALERKAQRYALGLQKRKDHPATIIAAGKSYYKKLGRSGPISPHNIFLKLRNKLSNIGELYTKQNNNYIGCCAEVNAANEVLLKLPYLSLFEITFSNAIRPRTMHNIPRCKNCRLTFE